MKKGLLSFIFSGCVLATGMAQQGDSLRQYVISESVRAFEMAFQDPFAAALRSRALLSKAETMRDDVAAAHAHNSLGWSYFHQGELDSSVILLRRSKDLFLSNRKPKEVIKVSINLSEVCLRKSAYQAALKHLLEADSVNAILGDPALHTDLSRQFAILYRELGSYDKATTYFLQAMDGFMEQGDYFRYVNTGISLSILYRKKLQWEESLGLLEKLEASVEQYELSPYQLAMVRENQGETYFGKQDFQSALVYFEEALQLFSTLALGADMAYEALNVGKSHKQLGQWDDAAHYLQQAYHLSDSLELTNYSYEVALELSSLFASKNDWEPAYSFADEARILFDSLNMQEQLRFSRELAEKYENDKKAQEIALLNTRNELNESKRKRAGILVYFLVAVTLASLAIAWLMRKSIRLNKKLEHERNQNRIAGDIEDERILNQMVVSLLGKHSVSDILHILAYSPPAMFGFGHGRVYTVAPDGDGLVLHAEANRELIMQNGQLSKIHVDVAVGEVLTSGKSILLQSNGENHQGLGKGAGDVKKSEIAAPVNVDGKVYAIAGACHEGAVQFSERQLRLLERAAALCAERISKLINEDKLRQHIARDLHDEVGSTLTSINILSKLATNHTDPRQGEYLHKIHAYSGHMMESMSDIIWAINPSHDSLQETLLRMKDYAVELIESAGMGCTFDVQGNTDANTLEPEERKYIYLIFREAVHNAVKYSGAQRIDLLVSQSDASFTFRVQDDGIGFELNGTNSGNGIQNMHDRAKAIHANLEIITAKGCGTAVQLVKGNAQV